MTKKRKIKREQVLFNAGIITRKKNGYVIFQNDNTTYIRKTEGNK